MVPAPAPAACRRRYLLHLDGQALSSRMDQLLPLNSLIFKEESGYKVRYLCTHPCVAPGPRSHLS